MVLIVVVGASDVVFKSREGRVVDCGGPVVRGVAPLVPLIELSFSIQRF